MGYPPVNVLLHLVVPVLVHWWQPIVWMAYPGAYAALALAVLNTAGRRAPYYFLDPDSVGTATVVVNICVLACSMLALSYTLLAVNRAVATARIDAA